MALYTVTRPVLRHYDVITLWSVTSFIRHRRMHGRVSNGNSICFTPGIWFSTSPRKPSKHCCHLVRSETQIWRSQRRSIFYKVPKLTKCRVFRTSGMWCYVIKWTVSNDGYSKRQELLTKRHCVTSWRTRQLHRCVNLNSRSSVLTCVKYSKWST